MTPHGNRERIEYLDFLRGIAVLGLLFMNIPFMGAFETGYVRHDPAIMSDNLMLTLSNFFFDGRFRSLFCLLFAIGLFLQSQSYQRQNLNTYVSLKSRLNWLLLFGLIHCTFIWSGDILILYALSGFYLMRRLDWPAERLMQKGKLFFLIGIGISVLEALAWTYFETPITRDSTKFIETYEMLNEGYTYTIMVNFFIGVFYIVTFPILSLFYIGGVMMLGLGLFKSGELRNGFSQQQTRILLAITVSFSSIAAYLTVFQPQTGRYIAEIISFVSGLSMALLIWHWVIKSRLYEQTNLIVIAIKRVGTMAFTFYITQSIAGTLLLRYLYPEWNLSFNLVDYFMLALTLVVIQLIIALVYKQMFRQGPLEFLWRKLVRHVQQEPTQASNSKTSIEQSQTFDQKLEASEKQI